jgi:hypothetical protein
MEYIKTQLQLMVRVQGGSFRLTAAMRVGEAASWTNTEIHWHDRRTEVSMPQRLSGYSGCVNRYTVRSTGFFSLYKGLTPTLLGSIPKAGIRFGGNSYFKKLLADENEKLNPGTS